MPTAPFFSRSMPFSRVIRSSNWLTKALPSVTDDVAFCGSGIIFSNRGIKSGSMSSSILRTLVINCLILLATFSNRLCVAPGVLFITYKENWFAKNSAGLSISFFKKPGSFFFNMPVSRPSFWVMYFLAMPQNSSFSASESMFVYAQ